MRRKGLSGALEIQEKFLGRVYYFSKYRPELEPTQAALTVGLHHLEEQMNIIVDIRMLGRMYIEEICAGQHGDIEKALGIWLPSFKADYYSTCRG